MKGGERGGGVYKREGESVSERERVRVLECEYGGGGLPLPMYVMLGPLPRGCSQSPKRGWVGVGV